jgi:hypothetical protein
MSRAVSLFLDLESQISPGLFRQNRSSELGESGNSQKYSGELCESGNSQVFSKKN